MDSQISPYLSAEALALQLSQNEARDHYYDVWNDLTRLFGPEATHAVYEAPAYKEALARYEKTVVALETLLGPDAHCNHVDTDLWQDFSDFYKSEAGFRPRHHMTRAEVQAYLARAASEPAPALESHSEPAHC